MPFEIALVRDQYTTIGYVQFTCQEFRTVGSR